MAPDVNAAASAKVAGLLKDQSEAVALLERLTLKRTANLNIDFTHKAFLFRTEKGYILAALDDFLQNKGFSKAFDSEALSNPIEAMVVDESSDAGELGPETIVAESKDGGERAQEEKPTKRDYKAEAIALLETIETQKTEQAAKDKEAAKSKKEKDEAKNPKIVKYEVCSAAQAAELERLYTEINKETVRLGTEHPTTLDLLDEYAELIQ